MNKLWNISIVLSLIALSISAQKVNYSGYRIYRVVFESDDDVSYLLKLNKEGGEIRLLKYLKLEGFADVLVSPRKEKELLAELESGDLDNFNLINENIQEDVREDEEHYEIVRKYQQRLLFPADFVDNNTLSNK